MAEKQAKKQDQGSAALWIRENWRTLLAILAWLILFVTGSAGFGNIGTVSNNVQALQRQVEDLQRLVQAQQSIIQLQQEKIEFLTECLSRPLPWPGGRLCK